MAFIRDPLSMPRGQWSIRGQPRIVVALGADGGRLFADLHPLGDKHPAQHGKHAFDVPLMPSRFCDGQSYSVMYGAAEFETSFVEVIVRDRFVGGRDRIVPFGELVTRGWVEFRSSSLIRLIDLRGDGAQLRTTRIGAES